MVAVLTAVLVVEGMAQNLVPNPSFELGKGAPLGWQLNRGMGDWELFGRTGKRSISVTGTGEGSSNVWEYPI